MRNLEPGNFFLVLLPQLSGLRPISINPFSHPMPEGASILKDLNSFKVPEYIFWGLWMLFSFTPNKGNTAQQSIQLTLLTITLTSNVTQLRATPKTKELLKLQFPFPDGTFLFIVAYFENILCICCITTRTFWSAILQYAIIFYLLNGIASNHVTLTMLCRWFPRKYNLAKFYTFISKFQFFNFIILCDVFFR